MGSADAALAYEHLEELNTALHRLKEAQTVRHKTDMTQVNLDIERFRKIHPKVDHSKK